MGYFFDDLIHRITFFANKLHGGKMLPASKGVQGLPDRATSKRHLAVGAAENRGRFNLQLFICKILCNLKVAAQSVERALHH